MRKLGNKLERNRRDDGENNEEKAEKNGELGGEIRENGNRKDRIERTGKGMKEVE